MGFALIVPPMPKSIPSPVAKPAQDDPPSRMSDVALRKKKNADAQAAFRARRANYIATLEETVTSLESVVLQLQDSCREARHETQELRQENTFLRQELRDREKLWKALWQARKAGQDVDLEDLPPLPASAPPQNGLVGSLPLNQYGNGSLHYRVNEDVTMSSTPYSHQCPSQTSYMPFSGEPEVSVDSPSHSASHRTQRYSPYPYPVHGVHRDSSWSSTVPNNPSSTVPAVAATPNNHVSRSPNFVGSPIQHAADLQYPARFPPEDPKTPLSALDTAPYVFPSSRSLSPTTSTPSSSSTSLTSFPFTFQDGSSHDRTDLDYRRHSHPHGAEVTLHGGTADVSLMSSASDAVRYRLGTRQLGSDRPLLPSLPISGSDNGSQNDQGSSDGDATPYSHGRLQARRTAQSPSRSPSPGTPAISGTLAVIKAQAFGALRRTRARTKKTSDGAAKVAMDVLEARGIGMNASGSNLKRQRVDDDIEIAPLS